MEKKIYNTRNTRSKIRLKRSENKAHNRRGRINNKVVIRLRILGYIRTKNIFNIGVRCHILIEKSYYKIYKKAKITRQKAEKLNPRKNEKSVKKRNKKINPLLEENRKKSSRDSL
jgi:hypothetical protein